MKKNMLEQQFKPRNISPLPQVRRKLNFQPQPENNVINGWSYLQKNPQWNEVYPVLGQISDVIQQSYELGNYILPKTTNELKDALEKGRMIIILGRNENGQLDFLSSCMYSELGKNLRGQVVYEVGGVITNPAVTVDRTKKTPSKSLVFPINSYLTNTRTSFATQALKAIIAQIQQNDPNGEIIATTRSLRSQLALLNTGFRRQDWTQELQNLSCDSRCLGCTDHKNCHLADQGFTNIKNQSGCHLMVYPKKIN